VGAADDEVGPEAIAWSFWALMSDGRTEEALALLDDDGVYWVSTIDARDDRPMATMKEFFRQTAELVPMKFTRHDALVAGERVALEIESYAETDFGLYNNRYCFIMTVRGGKIVAVREYVDTKHAAEVLIPQIRQVMRATRTPRAVTTEPAGD
jgi:uncharacterized protein